MLYFNNNEPILTRSTLAGCAGIVQDTFTGEAREAREGKEEMTGCSG